MSSGDPQQPYDYDPYSGQPYPYQPQSEYGAGYPQPMPVGPYVFTDEQDGRLRSWAIGALVTNIALTMLCWSPVSIAGVVVSGLAMGRAELQPDSARTLLKWAWGLAIASVVLAILLIAGFVVLVVMSGSR